MDLYYYNEKVLYPGIFRLSDNHDPSKFWDCTNNRFASRSNNKCNYLIKEDHKELSKIIKEKSIPVEKGMTLYFSKTSKFPRFKLQDSELKRCIKSEKADAIVIGDKVNIETKNRFTLFRDEKYLYLIPAYVYTDYEYNNLQWNNIYKIFRDDPFKYIKENHLYFGDKIEIICQGETLTLLDSSGEDIIKVLNGTYTNLIEDTSLDIFVNKKYEVLTEEVVLSICEMLDSPDNEVKTVGLKMLVGFNVQATPVLVKTILGTRYLSLYQLPEWNSVGVQNLINSLEFNRWEINSYDGIKYIKNIDKVSEDEKRLLKVHAICSLKRDLNKFIEGKLGAGLKDILNVNCEYKIW